MVSPEPGMYLWMVVSISMTSQWQEWTCNDDTFEVIITIYIMPDDDLCHNKVMLIILV